MATPLLNALESELANQSDSTMQSNVNEEEQLANQQTVVNYDKRKQQKTPTQTQKTMRKLKRRLGNNNNNNKTR